MSSLNPEYEKMKGTFCRVCGRPCYETNGLWKCKDIIYCGNHAPENAEEIKFEK